MGRLDGPAGFSQKGFPWVHGEMGSEQLPEGDFAEVFLASAGFASVLIAANTNTAVRTSGEDPCRIPGLESAQGLTALCEHLAGVLLLAAKPPRILQPKQQFTSKDPHSVTPHTWARAAFCFFSNSLPESDSTHWECFNPASPSVLKKTPTK